MSVWLWLALIVVSFLWMVFIGKLEERDDEAREWRAGVERALRRLEADSEICKAAWREYTWGK